MGRQEELAERESKSQDSFLHQEKKPWAHKPHLAAETRPNLKQRFPSRDIWEDTPDSLQLQTTVDSPQVEDKDLMSPPDDQPATSPLSIAAVAKPRIPARPAKPIPRESTENVPLT